ncbi:acyl-CoA thioesterase [Paenibacillus sp. N1-5-1-14]|uniref:acyl-CoA thioesterase n=1 Tax=Paenibacillus radicibacter TaxID=2972488 RepID=UPI0021596F7A|nr:thioesterase family protein [Paenibacillus radicibacter]MCR8643715.1 acyl-CoA thioesterase [Paenibacillus radicibacter]
MESKWFKHEQRVRYQETDQMGVVYHANYLNWFEIGRTELIREMGYPYQVVEQKGLLLPVVEAEMKFHTPARYDDRIVIYTRIQSYTAIKVEFNSQIRRISEDAMASDEMNMQADGDPQGELLVSGATRHVWVNRAFRPVRLDKELPELYALINQP